MPSWKLLTAIGGVLGARTLLRRSRRVSFADRIALITGGSRGLGLVLARELIGRGATVAIAARDADELQRAKLDLEALGGRVHTVVCDVTDGDAVQRMITEVQDEVGPIDLLINNAGVIQVGPLECIPREDYQRAIDTHLFGPLATITAVLPAMKRRGAGRIVNIASIGGKIAVPHLASYSASKFALVGLSSAMRQELAPLGIYVTTVCPGLMRTGSPRHAMIRGNHEAEYAWFDISASLPGTSMSAERAARQIIDAAAHGDAELVLSIPARLAALVAGIAPSFVQEVGSLVAALLPSAAGADPTAKAGKDAESAVAPSILTRLGDHAAVRNNEV